MSRTVKARGYRKGKVLGVLLCLALIGVAAPSSASATQVVYGQIGFANRSLDIGVAYGFGTTVKGRFTSFDNDGAAGDQVAGGPLCQVEYVRSGPNPGNLALFKQSCISIPPGANTHNFEFAVSPGPSRVIGFVYGDNGFHFSPDHLYFNVAFRPQLYPQERVVRNGERVKFVGAIPAFFFQPAPPMRLQVRTGKKWRTFKTLTVQNDGSYVGVYRFTNTRSRQTYKFRVKPIPNGSYPIVLSPSPKAKVIVKP
jgi:hypothetical protein